MKRYGNLYDKIYDMDNLKLAHRYARRNKSRYKEVKMVDSNVEFYLSEIQQMMINKTYITSEYEVFKRWDKTKEREIYKLPYYPDRILQWAIMLVIEPILEKQLIYDTYSAIPNKGIHTGLYRVRKALQDKGNTKYCLKFDIRHYYPSINHELLKSKYRSIFKDNDLLWIINEIIDSVEMTEGTGIPIGNYLSQWSANLFLGDFDHWMKEEKKCKYYFRYMDDVVILAKTKDELYQLLQEIKKYMDNIKLELKGNYQIFPVDMRGIDFLGYRMFHDFTLLRKNTCKNMKRKLVKISKRPFISYHDNCTIQSYIGWLKWCDSYRLKNKYMKGLMTNESTM